MLNFRLISIYSLGPITMPNLTDLEYFLRVAKLGSLSAAAEHFDLSVPGLSKAMSRLETDLGVRLFARSPRSIALTETGKSFVSDAEGMLAQWRACKENLQSAMDHPAGTVKITCASAFGRSQVVPLIKAFNDRYPDVVVDLFFDDHYVDLSRGEFDLSIRVGLLTEENIIARPLTQLTMQYCASRRFWQQFERPNRPQDLVHLPTIGFRLPASKKIMPWQFKQAGEVFSLDLKPKVIVNTPEAILDLIFQDLGVGLTNSHMTQALIASGDLIPVLEEWMPDHDRGIYLCYLNRDWMPARQRVLIDFLLEHFQPANP